jgi:hypothetical protein
MEGQFGNWSRPTGDSDAVFPTSTMEQPPRPESGETALTQYEAALVAGEDRDALRAAIHAAGLRQFPWLRHDPRPFPPIEPRLALDEFSAQLSDFKTLTVD